MIDFSRTAFLILLGSSVAFSQWEEIGEFCGETIEEAPEACGAAIVAAIVAGGIEAAFQDSPFNQRIYWIQNFITDTNNANPNTPVLAIATYYNNPFEHGSGVGKVIGDCGHTHHEIPMRGDWGTTQGVEIYTPGPNANCCVEKWGDGGWTNWGYAGPWSMTQTSSGSYMMCHNSPPPPPPPASTMGIASYSFNNDLVTVNGIVGRHLSDGGPLYSWMNPRNSLFKWKNAQSGPYFQAVIQTDGNFVVYYFDANNLRTPVFYTNTGGHTDNSNWEIVPEDNGNLVLYPSNTGGIRGQPIWSSQTSGIDLRGGIVGLSMQQDGNLVLYAFYSDGTCDPIWAANGNSPAGQKVWPH